MTTTATTGTGSGAMPYIAEREAYVRKLLAQRYEAAQVGDVVLVGKLDRSIADAEHTLAWMKKSLTATEVES